MRRLLERLRREDGVALLMVVFVTLLMAVVSVAMMELVTSETKRSGQAVTKQTSFQAAEAGVDAYTSKLLEDSLYYTHQVASGESTRRTATGTLVAAGGTWNSGPTWTYPNGHDAWSPQLPNGFEYNLQITAPDSTGAIKILSVGRRHADTNKANWREVQVIVRPSSLADYYRVVNGDVSFGSTTTTNGQVYANGDITHDGTASANLYAEGDVTGSYSLSGGAKVYDHNTNPTIRSKIPTPIQFSGFLASLVDIQTAANAGGKYLYDNTRDAWVLVFQSNGTFTAKACKKSGTNDVAAVAPTNCTATATYPVPANGAIYSPQTVIVSGVVVGRVTVGSNNNIDIAGNISYGTAGQDVLGLVALNDVIICQYTPTNLTWTAAVIAQSGTWKTWSQDGSHGTMTFTGSSTTANGGSMTMFDTRIYGYDDYLHQLPPPWFPVIEDSYTTVLFREVPPS